MHFKLQTVENYFPEGTARSVSWECTTVKASLGTQKANGTSQRSWRYQKDLREHGRRGKPDIWYGQHWETGEGYNERRYRGEGEISHAVARFVGICLP